MHSSRMHTICCPSCLQGGLSAPRVSALGGGVCPGDCLPWGHVCLGVSVQGGVCPCRCLPRGLSAWGLSARGGVCHKGVCLGVSAQVGVCPGRGVCQTPPTPVKTLSCRNYVADGKNNSFTIYLGFIYTLETLQFGQLISKEINSNENLD